MKQRAKLVRGEPMPTGGIYVGTSPNKIDWVAYKGEDFGPMCQAFDELYAS